MFLACNIRSSIHRYYEKLNFEACDSWNIVGQQVTDCVTLESKDLSDLVPYKLSEVMRPSTHTSRDLLFRTLSEIERPSAEIKESPDSSY